MKIRRLLAINVPIKNCNLKCEYCYISALSQVEKGPANFKYSPEHVGKCLSKERLGGACVINLTGGGETLIPKEMPRYIYELLKQGHVIEVVTNGTLTERFKEIATFPKEYLKRLEFKFSFHYNELMRLGILDRYFSNVRMMRDAGCSFTIELMPYDSLIDKIPEIIEICKKEVGAVCQLTVGRNDLTPQKDILTAFPREEYEKTWSIFESTMFDFKLNILKKKISNFCYAGNWSLYIDLGTGATKPCYGQLCNQNVFDNPDKPIIFNPVGCHCRQPYCYNGHAFLTMGTVPELDTPTYADIRNRVTENGNNWLKDEVYDAFSQKLKDNNETWSEEKKGKYERTYIPRMIKDAIYDRNEIYEKVIKKRFKKH
jgi:organic radical activating enzyme